MGGTAGADRAALSEDGSPRSAAVSARNDAAGPLASAVVRALSDPAMEEALYDTAVMRRFSRLSGLDNVPGETTIRPGSSGRFKASPPRKIAAAAELAHCAIVLCP